MVQNGSLGLCGFSEALKVLSSFFFFFPVPLLFFLPSLDEVQRRKKISQEEDLKAHYTGMYLVYSKKIISKVFETLRPLWQSRYSTYVLQSNSDNPNKSGDGPFSQITV